MPAGGTAPAPPPRRACFWSLYRMKVGATLMPSATPSSLLALLQLNLMISTCGQQEQKMTDRSI